MKRLRGQSPAGKIVRKLVALGRRLRQVGAIRSAVLMAVVAVVGIAAALVLNAAPAKVQNAAKASKPAANPAGNAANGRRLFKKDGCYECHGLEAQGSIVSGPRLGPDPIPLAAIIAYVRNPTGQMPPYTEKVVPDKELADIYAFLKLLPHPPPAKAIPLLHN